MKPGPTRASAPSPGVCQRVTDYFGRLRLSATEYRLFSRHTRDLQLFMVFWIVSMLLLIVATVILMLIPKSRLSLSPTVALPFIGVFVTASTVIGQRIHDQATKRLQTIDLLLSEIRSICSVMYGMSLIRRCEEQFFQAWVALPASDTRLESKENYFEVFSKVISELGGLRPDVVIEVTAFYSHLKGSRDAWRSMLSWTSATPKESRQIDVIDTAIQIHLCLRSAERSIKALAETEPSHNDPTLLIIRRMCERSWLFLQTADRSDGHARTKRVVDQAKRLGVKGKICLKDVESAADSNSKADQPVGGSDLDFWLKAQDEAIDKAVL